MDKIKLRFTDNIIKIATKNTPQKIKTKYVVNNEASYKYGYVRFDNNKLKSIYIYPNGYEINESWYSVLFKFDYLDNRLIFKYVYDFLKNTNDNTFIEGRFDKNLKLESEYIHYDERKSVNDGHIFCTKQKKGKTINYVFRDKPKIFLDYFNYLEKNNIIVNNGNHKFCFWGEKQNSNVKYLVITT